MSTMSNYMLPCKLNFTEPRRNIAYGLDSLALKSLISMRVIYCTAIIVLFCLLHFFFFFFFMRQVKLNIWSLNLCKYNNRKIQKHVSKIVHKFTQKATKHTGVKPEIRNGGGANFGVWGQSPQLSEAGGLRAKLPALENFAFFCKKSLILELF